MGMKLAVAGAIAIAMFYLVTSPESAAGAVRGTGVWLQHAAHQVAVFLKSV